MATGVAFLHTESLKLETSPIRQTQVTKLFSPVCRCDTSKAQIAFRLENPDVVSVTIVDRSGTDVRRLVIDEGGSGRLVFLWNGKDDRRRLVPDGIYRARVRLDLVEKTFDLPNPIRVDTKRPQPKVVSVQPRVFSPDGDRRADRISLRYTVDEPARAMMYVDGVRRVVGASRQPSGELRWFGTVGAKPLPAGRYRLTIAAVDLAGNRSLTVPAGDVTIRYIRLGSALIQARPGGPVSVRVDTDAARVTWRLGARSGVGKVPVFRFRAPTSPGRYFLVVSAQGHQVGATVVVTEG